MDARPELPMISSRVMVGSRLGAGIGSSRLALEGYWASPFPTPGMLFRLLFGVLVKNGCAKRMGLVFLAGAGFEAADFLATIAFFGAGAFFAAGVFLAAA